jgi:hypothetical protein
METCTLWNKPLAQRLRRGRGALVCHGDFWYPVRVVHLEGYGQWRVRWWRECAFSIPGLVVDTMSTVPEENIIDCLWNNRLGRRQIRVHQENHFFPEGTHSRPWIPRGCQETQGIGAPWSASRYRFLFLISQGQPEVVLGLSWGTLSCP